MEQGMLTRLAAFLGSAALLAGCVDLPDAPLLARDVTPGSPLADRVEAADAAARGAGYPDLASVPSVPSDVRGEAEYRTAAGELLTGREELEAWTAANPPELTDTERFAATARDGVGIDPATLPPAPTPEESAAYARAQQQRAAPRD